MRSRIRHWTVTACLVCFLAASLQPAAQANLISTQEYLNGADRAASLARVDAVLAREEVTRRLSALGVAPEQARLRAAALNDVELAALAENLEQLPAGGVLEVVGVVFVVLLILELVGVTNIFSGF